MFIAILAVLFEISPHKSIASASEALSVDGVSWEEFLTPCSDMLGPFGVFAFLVLFPFESILHLETRLSSQDSFHLEPLPLSFSLYKYVEKEVR